jgi:hypothetical protein
LFAFHVILAVVRLLIVSLCATRDARIKSIQEEHCARSLAAAGHKEIAASTKSERKKELQLLAIATLNSVTERARAFQLLLDK